MLKALLAKIGMSLVKFLNLILEKGPFPEEWTKGMICTMHKKGSVTDPENYRSISLLPTLCKTFTKILNERLNKYANQTGLKCEEQAVNCKIYSTIQQIFVSQCLVQKHLCRLYAIFVDFAKAFDG